MNVGNSSICDIWMKNYCYYVFCIMNNNVGPEYEQSIIDCGAFSPIGCWCCRGFVIEPLKIFEDAPRFLVSWSESSGVLMILMSMGVFICTWWPQLLVRDFSAYSVDSSHSFLIILSTTSMSLSSVYLIYNHITYRITGDFNIFLSDVGGI